MLSCTDCLARHSEYLDGRLDPQMADEVRTHLAACASCARFDRVLRRGLKVLQAQTPLELGADFSFQLHQRIALEQQRASLRPIRSMAAASVAVAAMLAFAAWIPVLMLATQEETAFEVVQNAEASPVSAEIAWHGAPAVARESHDHVNPVRRASWKPSADHHVIAPRYTPVVVELPTAPLSYNTVILAE